MKKTIALIGLLAGLTAQARNYGDAGCGLGSVVIGKEPGMMQILAATLNGTGVQTFGITTGTSNCVEDGAVASQKEVPLYIEINRTSLATDAARGGGETVAGLAQLMGCNTQSFSQALKSNYDKVFVNTKMQANGIESEIKNLVKSQPQQACGA